MKNKTKHMDQLLDLPEVRSWLTLMSAFKRVLSYLESGLAQEGCSLSRFQILFWLFFEGDLSATKMAQKLLVTRGNMSMFLKRIEGDQLIVRKFEVGSKRAKYRITSKGRSYFVKIFPRHIKRVCSIVPKLDQKSLKILSKISDHSALSKETDRFYL